MPTHLVTANIPALWAGLAEVVTIDGILPSGRHFIQDPGVRILENVTSAEVLSRVTTEEFAEANRAHDELLDTLGRELNRLHGVSRPTRYWLILLGPWLRQFSHVVFCRWYTLRDLLRRHPDLVARTVDVDPEILTPQSHDEASLMFFTEPWNAWVYGELLRQMHGDAAVVPVAAEADLARLAAYRADRHYGLPRGWSWTPWRRAAMRALAWVNLRARGVVVATVFSPWETLRLFWHLRLVPQVWGSPMGLSPWTVNRSVLATNALAFGAFARVVVPLVRWQVPAIYVEGLADLGRASADLRLPRAPRWVFSHNAYLRNDAFKAWAADRATSVGTRLVGAQHGGGYGVYLHDNWTGMHEDAALDRFHTWGWSREPRHDAIGVQLDERAGPDHCGGLLLVVGPLVRMSNNLSLLQCSHVVEQHAVIDALVDALPAAIRSRVVLRPKASGSRKPARAQGSDFARFAERMEVSEGICTLSADLSRSRLAVVLYNETTLPMNLCSDFPTVALWRASFTRLAPDALAHYDALREGGILHESPESCARHIAAIWDDVAAWWDSATTRASRRGFAETYARRSEDLVRATARTLRRNGTGSVTA
jgi:putative transferase (TIGR04331 family)